MSCSLPLVLESTKLRPNQHPLGSDPRDGKEGSSQHLLESANRQSGVTFHEAQVALAKVYVGSDDVKGGDDEVVNIERPHDERTSVDQIGKKDTVAKAIKLPKTLDEAKDIIKRFQDAAVKSDKNV
jgi:phospholipase D1/2